MDDQQTTWAFSRNFTSQFRSTYTELEARLADAKASPTPEAIQSLSVDVAQVAKSLSDAAGSLPTYDQRLYETQVGDLEKSLNELRISVAPKTKFAFKRRTAATPSSTPPTAAATASIQDTTASSSHSLSNSRIASHSYAYLTTHALTGLPPQSDLTISDLDHCILNLLPAADQLSLDISALHLRNITNSVLLLPRTNGSALIHNISRCLIVIGCHQFRMHSATQVDVFLSIASNPIIEDCRCIRFAPYPKALSAPEESATTSLNIQDFSHIRNTPSPNWIHLDGADLSRPWPTHVLSCRADIEDSLRSTLPL